jgi:hypothetical protein
MTREDKGRAIRAQGQAANPGFSTKQPPCTGTSNVLSLPRLRMRSRSPRISTRGATEKSDIYTYPLFFPAVASGGGQTYTTFRGYDADTAIRS